VSEPLQPSIGITAGSFDPITNGHMYIIEEGAKLFDKFLVVVTNNPAKKYMFTLNERFDMVEEASINITTVISGDCEGVDKLGEKYADGMKLDKVIFPANWSGRGNSAGPIRNQKMVDYAEAAIIICKKDSVGSMDCYNKAVKRGLKVHIQFVEFDNALKQWKKV